MKKTTGCLFVIFIFLSSIATAQEFYLNAGITLAEQSTGTGYIHMDSLGFYEINRHQDKRIISGLSFYYPVFERLSVGLGFRYRKTYIGIGVLKKIDHPVGLKLR
jgi:hypothetical protein